MNKLGLVTALMFTSAALAQTNSTSPPGSLMKAPEAFGPMSPEQMRETGAYTLGVQAVVCMQWVRAGQAFRLFSWPLPAGQERSPYDENPHGISIWGRAQKLLDADFHTIETPNTKTLYLNREDRICRQARA